jgi:hypothetical protein
MRVALAIACASAACGRVGFDAIDGGGTTGDGPPFDGDPSACPADARLIACYAFDGNVTDGSANANHLTATAVGFAGGVDGMAAVTSTSSRMEVPGGDPSFETSVVTTDAWIRPTALPPSNDAMVFDNDQYYSIRIAIGGAVQCGHQAVSGSVRLDSDVTVVLDTWTHIACVHSAQSITVFVAGVPRGILLGSDPIRIGTGEVAVGGDAGIVAPEEAFVGALDRVRIWNQPLSPAEICAAAGRSDC